MKREEMTPEEQEYWRQELLEYHYGCHADPQSLKTRLAEDDALRRFYENHVIATASLFDSVARDDEALLNLDVGKLVDSVMKDTEPETATRGLPLRVGSFTKPARAAAILIAGTLAVLFGASKWMSVLAERAANADLHLSVEGPSRIPDLSTGEVLLQTQGKDGQPKASAIEWKLVGEDGESLSRGSLESNGESKLSLPPSKEPYARLIVDAKSDTSETSCEWIVGATRATPLGHIRTDRASYEPEDVVYVRGLFLERLTMEPIEGKFQFRVVDPKDEVIKSAMIETKDGVASFSWRGDGTTQGFYRIEWAESAKSPSMNGATFLIRSVEPPRLHKVVTLSQSSYSPGDSGEATVSVQRIGGGHLAHADIDASVFVDESVVWRESLKADSNGNTTIFFSIPHEAVPGPSRLVIRVRDRGLNETQVTAFDVTRRKPHIQFYPEGGDLVAGVSSRVYMDCRDELGNPMKISGAILDLEGQSLVEVDIPSNGLGRLSWTPKAEQSYRFVADDGFELPLPNVAPFGVALSSKEDVTAPGDPVRVSVALPDERTWTVGLFCRGVLVADHVLSGRGSHPVSLNPGPEIFGVLRVTLFDEALIPRAERLVYRQSGKALNIHCELGNSELGPGAQQQLKFLVTDDEGRGVRAVLGVSVADRAARLASPKTVMGLRSYMEFGADLDSIEDISEFMVDNEGGHRAVDLLLGTYGWRRFAWYDSDEFIALGRDDSEVVLAQEGLLLRTHRVDSKVQQRERSASYREKSQRFREFAIGFMAILTIGGAVFFVTRASWRANRERSSNPWIQFGLPAIHGVSLFIVLVVGVGSLLRSELDSMAPVSGFLSADSEATESSLAESKESLRSLGYVIGDEVEPWIDSSELDLLELALVADIEGEDKKKASPTGLRKLVREYAHKRIPNPNPWMRHDIEETVYWNASLNTNDEGVAQVSFDMSDRVTAWDVIVEGHGESPRGHAIGAYTTSFETRVPLNVDLVLPRTARPGDRLEIPILITSEDASSNRALVRFLCDDLEVEGETLAVSLEDGRGRGSVSITVPSDFDGPARLIALAHQGDFVDGTKGHIHILEQGFEKHVTRSGVLVEQDSFHFTLPQDAFERPLTASWVTYPTPLDTLWDGLDGMLREPHGCFEQVSSSTYPNLLVLSLVEKWSDGTTEIQKRARRYLETGYEKLISYEVEGGGFDWFGQGPSSVSLTAFGLMEFVDMAEVFPVDPELLDRTRAWLLSQRDGKGGFLPDPRRLSSVGEEIADAFVCWSLLYAGVDSSLLSPEIDRLTLRAKTTQDAYELALLTHALGHTKREDAGREARYRLSTMQDEDGKFSNTRASWTGSGLRDRAVETTSLALLAFMKDPQSRTQFRAPIEKGMRFVGSCREASGRFGATQATILALKALVSYEELERQPLTPGQLELWINGERETVRRVDPTKRGAIRVESMAHRFDTGDQEIELRFSGEGELPWTFDISYRSTQPSDDQDAPLVIDVTLTESEIEEGERTGLGLRVRSLSPNATSMGMAVIGLPSCLRYDPAMMETMKVRGAFDHWEARDQELILYWRGFEGNEAKDLVVDVIGAIPGESSGTASRAYLYYTPQSQLWGEPLSCRVLPKR